MTIKIYKLKDNTQLDIECRKILSILDQKETEESWTPLNDALQRLTYITRGSSKLTSYVPWIKRFKLFIKDLVQFLSSFFFLFFFIFFY